MDIGDFANELPPESRLGGLSSYLREEVLECPVDMYNLSISRIIKYGGPKQLAESDFLGRMLVLGIVSAIEAYFRGLLSSCIELCPIARSVAAKQNIQLGGLLWHGRSGYSRSAFEHLSFASKDELSGTFKKFLGVTLEDKDFKALLDEFDIICQLRHGIAHGDGLLPGRNAVHLNIPRYSKPVRIIVGYEQLQDVASVANTLVMTINRHMFEVMCKRWAIEWRQRADWDIELEKRSFTAIWELFHSTEDAKRRRAGRTLTRAKCLLAIRSAYNI